MYQNLLKLISSNLRLTVAGGLVVSAGAVGAVYVFFGTPSGNSKQPEQVAQTKPTNSNTNNGDNNNFVQDAPGSQFDMSRKDSHNTNNVRGQQINTEHYNDNRNQETINCDKAIFDRGSICVNSNGGKVENHF
jgi:hypothetical protein